MSGFSAWQLSNRQRPFPYVPAQRVFPSGTRAMQTGSSATSLDSSVLRSMAVRPSKPLTHKWSEAMQVPKQDVVFPGYLE